MDDSLRRRRKSVLHLWESAKLSDSKYTVSAEFDWAYCTPLINGGSSWGIYVTGTLGQPFVPGAPAHRRRLSRGGRQVHRIGRRDRQLVLRLNRYERQKWGCDSSSRR